MQGLKRFILGHATRFNLVQHVVNPIVFSSFPPQLVSFSQMVGESLVQSLQVRFQKIEGHGQMNQETPDLLEIIV